MMNSKTFLGIEFGSTRIKAVLIDENFNPLAQGVFDWENKLEDEIWTYSLHDVIKGMQGCYSNLKANVKKKYDVTLKRVDAIGVSAMMHGYMPFDNEGNQLCQFRTWRNTITSQAANELTELFNYNIPQRWSIAHLYQAILNKEKHIYDINRITTLAGYVHFLLSGENVLGIGDASGMFPIDTNTCDYDLEMINKFNIKLSENGLNYDIKSILPKALKAGEYAGKLTKSGALLLDVDGELEMGIPMCPPEGDAGTGMVATNSIKARTGNISAGTSIFAMVVLERPLSSLYTQIDMVSTPDGKPVAMVHCNNCTSDINAWADVFMGFAKSIGVELSKGQILDKMFSLGELGEKNCGGILSYNYFSGEHLVGITQGRPMVVRTPNSNFTVENFMRTHLYSAVAILKLGMDILLKKENVKVDSFLGHGGYFKAENVGQQIIADAMNTNVSTMKTADEGGAYGMAILSSFLYEKNFSLDEFLNEKVFVNCDIKTVSPQDDGVKGFEQYIKNYKNGISAEKVAAETIKE